MTFDIATTPRVKADGAAGRAVPMSFRRDMKRAWIFVWLLQAFSCASPPSEEVGGSHTWTTPISSWPGSLLSVSGTSAEDVWVVGANTDGAPTVLRWRGERWELVEPPSADTLWWVHALDENTVFVGGEGGTVARWRGERFERLDTPGGDDATVFGVWARGADDLYAVGVSGGQRGFVWRWEGASWRTLELPEPDGAIFKVWGDEDRVYVVGAGGRAYVRRGEGPFERLETASDETLLTVAGDPATGEVVAVGGVGSALVVTLAPRVSSEPLPLPFLQGVAFGADGGAWATGGRGTVLRRRSAVWEEVDLGIEVPGQSLQAVWVDPSGGVWAVGGDVVSLPLQQGVLLHGAPGQGRAPSAIDPCPQGGFVDAGCDAEPFDGGVPDLDASTDAGPVEPPFPAPVGAEADGDRDLGVGTGRDAFVALRHGDPLRWEAGIQGGHHVWVSARLTDGVLTGTSDAERREVTTRFTLTRRDGSPLGELTRRGGYRSVGGAWELVGNFSVLPPGIRPSRLDDEALHLTVSVTVSGAGSPDLVREVWARSECCD